LQVRFGGESEETCRRTTRLALILQQTTLFWLIVNQKPYYVYRVRAADAAGNLSGYSATVSTTTQAASSSFTVSASPSTVAPGGTITVSYTAPSNHSTTDWVSIFNQGVADTAYNSWKYVPTGTSGTLTLTASSESGNPLPAGTYEVRYYLNDGFTRVATSNKVTVSSSSDITAPSTPTDLTAAAVSSSQINLSWSASSDNVGITGYKVYRNGTQITTIAGTSYQNTGLSPSTTYTYTVVAYDAAGNVSAQSASATTPSTSGQFVMSFTLVNADTDEDIQSLNNGATLNLATLPTRNLNIRANTSPSLVGSVKFGYDSSVSYRIENTAPYAFAGDSSGNYYAWTPTIGSHTITVTPYTGSNATGVAGTPLRVSFTVR
jgi:fibronectin type III domain protein